LTTSSTSFFKDNGIPSVEKDVLISKLDGWVDEALDGEKPARLTTKSRILDTYHRNLIRLDLSGLGLTTLPSGIFKSLTNLKKLYLYNNQLSTIHERTFNGLINLEELNLKNNQITTLSDGTFDELINLSDLNLSNNLLSSLSDNVFKSLIKLRWLELNNNRLIALQPRVFNRLATLKYVYLSDNRLSTIHHEVFNELANLRKLHLSNNQLNTIHERAFKGLTNLDELNLKHNQITTLLDGTFDELINLSDLTLSNNLLSSLSDNVFKSLINLNRLELDNNLLTELQYGVFKSLTTLEYLYLSSNRLSTINHGVFNELANLRKLHLSDNQLNTIHERAFNGLTNLKELDLKHNQLTTLLDGTFNELINLSDLYLSNNLLSSLPDRVFDELTQLKMVDLQENRFNIEAVDQIKSSLRRDSNIKIYISVYEGLPLPTLHHLSFENRFESLPPETIPAIITRNIISAYRASSLFETNLTLMDNLRKVFKQANSPYHLQMDWNQFEQPNIFNGFLNKINKMADTQKNPARKAIVYSNLTKIIIAMEQNPELREICFNLARESTQTCGDRVALGFIQMQIQAKLYKPNASLSELFTQQKILCALDIIFNLARNKVNSSSGIIDEVEVYLTYVKNLKDYLQVEITDILYEALSDVTQDDIENTRKCLNETLTDDYIYEALVDSEIVKIRYKDEFKVIQDQPEFDTSLQDEESDGAYKERMNNMLIKFKKEKISFLKAQLKSFASLPPLVEGD
ncbi:MAG: leucine-rich repeat protein, partial [Burkholderiales bacterium]